MMPLFRYFVFVGGALMTLLFAIDLFSPKAVQDSGISSSGMVDKSALRIRSEQKWPERIVFDTTQPIVTRTALAAPSEQAAPAVHEPAEISAKARVRETFAQFVPVEPKKAESNGPRKRKTAKGPGQPLRIARSAFGPTAW